MKKYADAKTPIILRIGINDNCLVIEQENRMREDDAKVESNGIGMESIQKIVQQYNGTVNIDQSSEFFRITLQISL